MKDVVSVLAAYVGADQLPAVLTDLEATLTAHRNLLFREMLRRIRHAAGLPQAVNDDAPKGLLALMETPKIDVDETTNSCDTDCTLKG